MNSDPYNSNTQTTSSSSEDQPPNTSSSQSSTNFFRFARPNDYFLDSDELNSTEERLEHETSPQPIDFYAVLNVERDADAEEIKNAFRRLSLLFHPDKHPLESDKEIAKKKFQLIRQAFNVLSDPVKRHIYDTYGVEGLSHNWDVSLNVNDPEAIRRELFKVQMEHQKMDAERLVQSRGTITLNVNASEVFANTGTVVSDDISDPSTQRENSEVKEKRQAIKLPQGIGKASVSHSWESKLSEATSLTIQGNASTGNGIGGGSVLGTVRHSFSHFLWGEFSAIMGIQPIFQAKAVRNFSPNKYVSLTSTLPVTTRLPPIFLFDSGNRFTKEVSAYFRFCTGVYSLYPLWGPEEFENGSGSFTSIGIIHRSKKQSQTVLEIQAGMPESSISASHYRHLKKQNIKLRIYIEASLNSGISLGVAGDKLVLPYTRLGVGANCGEAGVSLRLQVTRLGQKFAVPILLAPKYDFSLFLWAAFVPFCITFAVDRFVILPRRKKNLRRKLDELRHKNADLINQRKNDAISEIRLMSENVARKREAEESKNGLIIVEALYGKLSKTNNRENSGTGVDGSLLDTMYIDVTIPVMGLVNNSQLHISGGHSKSHMVGFYDPCLGERKKLRIKYKFQGRLHFVEVDDMTAVAAPLRAHLIEMV